MDQVGAGSALEGVAIDVAKRLSSMAEVKTVVNAVRVVARA